MREMSSKKEAIKIIDKYNKVDILIDGYYGNMFKDDAISCSIQAVDLLIKESANYNFERKAYWKQVKQELEKLR